MKIKTIDINALEWLDKVNGNSYFAGTVIVNYQMKTEKRFIMPFQYGYGSHYETMAGKLLQDKGIISMGDRSQLWQYCQDKGIILRSNKQINCRKRDLLRIEE